MAESLSCSGHCIMVDPTLLYILHGSIIIMTLKNMALKWIEINLLLPSILLQPAKIGGNSRPSKIDGNSWASEITSAIENWRK